MFSWAGTRTSHSIRRWIKNGCSVQFLKTLMVNCGSTTYGTWVRMDVLFNIRILKTISHGKNQLYRRKLEIATWSSYTWVKPMSELWKFVCIESHVTLHAKADAQKVNWLISLSLRLISVVLLTSFWTQLTIKINGLLKKTFLNPVIHK